MKRILLVTFFLSLPAFGVTTDGTFDKREQELLPNCEGMGGCAVISRAQLEQYVAALRAQWEQEIGERFGAAVKEQTDKVCKKTI